MPRSRSRSRGRDDRDRDRRKSRSRSRDRERRREKYRSSRRSRSRSRSPRGRDRSPIRRRSRDREPRVADTRPARDEARPPREEQREDSPPIGSDEETTIESFGLISKEITVDDLAAVEDDDERKMMELMGFGAFDTTKGKRVVGNDHYSAHIVRKRRYRQYMNRRGGFNRPLDFIA